MRLQSIDDEEAGNAMVDGVSVWLLFCIMLKSIILSIPMDLTPLKIGKKKTQCYSSSHIRHAEARVCLPAVHAAQVQERVPRQQQLLHLGAGLQAAGPQNRPTRAEAAPTSAAAAAGQRARLPEIAHDGRHTAGLHSEREGRR